MVRNKKETEIKRFIRGCILLREYFEDKEDNIECSGEILMIMVDPKKVPTKVKEELYTLGFTDYHDYFYF